VRLETTHVIAGKSLGKSVMILFIALGMFGGCGRSADDADLGPPARVLGTISVDESLDQTRDYSGIRVYVLDYSSTAGPDTVFRAVTDREGYFEGAARSVTPDLYRLEIHRGRGMVADTTMILAHGDTVRIDGVLPRFSGHADIRSRENDALQLVERLNRQFNRVIRLVSGGAVSQDTIPHIMDTWSDLYWEAYEKHPGMVSGRLAARESFRLLEQQSDERMLQRIREAGEDEQIRMLAAQFGFLAQLRKNGLDAGLAWIDSLETESTTRETQRQIAMNRIEILYDSSRTEDARRHIRDFEAQYSGDDQVARWLEILRYDIEYLARGERLPEFEMNVTEWTGEDLVSYPMTLDDLQGGPAVIEVARLSDRAYQQSFSQMVMLHGVYSDQGVRFLTIPTESNPVTVAAFFNERGQDWPVAVAGAYAESDLEERWNVYELPVRFLIDHDGTIVRKFHGNNFSELLIELYTLLTNGEVQ